MLECASPLFIAPALFRAPELYRTQALFRSLTLLRAAVLLGIECLYVQSLVVPSGFTGTVRDIRSVIGSSSRARRFHWHSKRAVAPFNSALLRASHSYHRVFAISKLFWFGKIQH